MMYLSQVNFVEKRFDFYKGKLLSMKLLKLLKLDSVEITMHIIAASLYLIKMRSGIETKKVSNIIRMIIVLILSSINKSKGFVVISTLGLIGWSVFANIYMVDYWWLFALVYVYVVVITVYLAYARSIIDVLNIQNSNLLENYINLAIGNEPVELLISSELAVQLIYDYTDELVNTIAFSEVVNRYEVIKQAADEIQYFINDNHLKKMFIAGGRYFHAAGLISLVDLCYSSLLVDLNTSCIRRNAIDALSEVENGKSRVVEDLKVVIHDWIFESMYDIDYIGELSDVELMIMLILCKDELLYLKDKYVSYDNM